MTMLTNDNYGQNSFPSVLFLKLDPLKIQKDTSFPSLKENYPKNDKI